MSDTSSTTTTIPSKRVIWNTVTRYLRQRAPSGYSLVVPEDGVMYVSDGTKQQHDRWYVQVVPDPEYIADTRRQEYLGILTEVQEMIHKKHRWTVYLTSMLPTV
ncbi:MAG: hypothetical protein WC058_13175 [Phycisphaeraceae bacterium]